MNDRKPTIWDNYPGIKSALSTLHEVHKPFGEAKDKIESICNLLSAAAHSYQEWIDSTFGSVQQFHEKILEVGKKVLWFTEIIQTIEKLGDAQLVYWEHLSPELIERIPIVSNTDAVLRDIFERDEYRAIYKIADTCAYHPVLGDNKQTLEQAIIAMRNGHFNLASVGIIAAIDGALSSATNDTSIKIFARSQKLLEKLSTEDAFSETELALTILFITFDKTMKSFSANIPFDQNEPVTINRNWIMHGRSSRKRTMLDCAKLIHFLYGIMLLSDLPNSI